MRDYGVVVAVMSVLAVWSVELVSVVVEVDGAGAVEEASGARASGVDVSICSGVEVEETNGEAF
jgi:hypothetical protein